MVKISRQSEVISAQCSLKVNTVFLTSFFDEFFHDFFSEQNSTLEETISNKRHHPSSVQNCHEVK